MFPYDRIYAKRIRVYSCQHCDSVPTGQVQSGRAEVILANSSAETFQASVFVSALVLLCLMHCVLPPILDHFSHLPVTPVQLFSCFCLMGVQTANRTLRVLWSTQCDCPRQHEQSRAGVVRMERKKAGIEIEKSCTTSWKTGDSQLDFYFPARHTDNIDSYKHCTVCP